MRPTLFDTSIYVPFFRKGASLEQIFENRIDPIYLSIVVLEELYAGETNPFTLKKLGLFREILKKHNRILTPTEEDWIQCGILLSKIGKRHGFESIKRSRLVNDVLIALSCHRIEGTLVTANLKDFKLIQEFLDFEVNEETI